MDAHDGGALRRAKRSGVALSGAGARQFLVDVLDLDVVHPEGVVKGVDFKIYRFDTLYERRDRERVFDGDWDSVAGAQADNLE